MQPCTEERVFSKRISHSFNHHFILNICRASLAKDKKTEREAIPKINILACILYQSVLDKKSEGWRFVMHAEICLQILAEEEAPMAFNMGLETAVYVLERAEALSADGRKFLLKDH